MALQVLELRRWLGTVALFFSDTSNKVRLSRVLAYRAPIRDAIRIAIRVPIRAITRVGSIRITIGAAPALLLASAVRVVTYSQVSGHELLRAVGGS